MSKEESDKHNGVTRFHIFVWIGKEYHPVVDLYVMDAQIQGYIDECDWLDYLAW